MGFLKQGVALMRTYRSCAWIFSLALASAAGVAAADDAAPAKPTGPSLSDVLDASGITATGYVDATYSYQHIETGSKDYSTFALQQAGLTVSKLPMTGFGALVNVVAGQNPYNATGIGSSPPGQGAGPTQFFLMQAYAQYVAGAWTLQGGKFATLAGAEVWAPITNTNVTRSLLFAAEPVTNTGIRVTYAVNEQLNLILGVNNGWTISEDTAAGSGKTLEAGAAFTPNKQFSATAQVYYGRDDSKFVTATGAVKANIGLFDTVVTWNATSAFTLVGSVDYGWLDSTSASPSASWWGVALYANYALTDQWRVSLRPEYLDDRDGYLSLGTSFDPATFVSTDQKLKEITLTLGYDPIKNFELRLEGRYDDPSKVAGQQVVPKTAQGWVEAYYKF
jgi:hypothetical protein